MAGFNDVEGNIIIGMIFAHHLAQKNKSLDDGCSAEDMYEFIQLICSVSICSECQELCTYFINNEYKIDAANNGYERIRRFSHFAGMVVLLH